MTSKSLIGFRTKPDKSGRVRLVKVYGHGLDASQRISKRKNANKGRVVTRKYAVQWNRAMSDTDEGLIEYLDPKSKYAGYEKVVLVEVRHNEGDEDGIAPDWRCDWSRTFSGGDAELVMLAIAARSGAIQTQALSIIRDCQKILAEHVDPSGPDAKETITKLLAILDGPRVRELMR